MDAVIPAHSAHWHYRITQIMQGLAIAMPVALVVGNALSDPLMSTLGIAFLLRSIFLKDFSWLKERWVQIALLLWAYIAIRSIFTEHTHEAVTRAALWGRFPLASAALAFWVLQDPVTRRRVLFVLAAVVAGLTLDTLFQYVNGTDILGVAYVNSPYSGIRLTGPFTNPKVGIILTWLCFPVMLAPFLTENGRIRSPRFLILGGLCMAGLAAAILLTGERMAVLLLLFGFGLTFLMLPIPRRYVGLIVLLAMGGMAALLYLKPHLMERQWNSTLEVIEHYPESIYGQIWQSGMNVGKEHLLFGVGTRHFRYACPDAAYGNPSPEAVAVRCNLHPHNYYIELFAENGFIGLGLFCLLVVAILTKAWHGWSYCRHNPIYLGLLIALLIRFWPIATTTSFFANWAIVPCWFFVGWLFALMADQKKKHTL